MIRLLKNIAKSAVAAGALLGAGCATGSQDTKEPIKASASIGWQSKYILGAGPEALDTPISTASFDVSTNGLTLSTWVGYNPRTDAFHEIDPLNVGYDIPLEQVGLSGISDHIGASAHVNTYTFPDPNVDLGNIHEAKVSLRSRSLPIDLGLDVSHFFGSGSNHGEIYSLTAGRSINLTDWLSASARVRVDYKSDFAIDQKGFSHAQEDIGLNVDLGKVRESLEGLTLSGGFRTQQLLNDNYGGLIKDNNNQFTLGLGYRF